ncbi:hypothetical protein NK553_18850 [Pseudomonas sp. ZM23]|jgi:hypothetical protein|uniref:2TM domain-containing protein n=2 Tax=Pseudomonadota TaxID=1224 RepID=A0AAW7T1V8_BURVI|nr:MULTISPECIES: hypothetical protein [Pseudomonadota]MCP8477314.1 hypothetical protein [Pseudomonas triclosanedens]HEJ6533423.1 hypothetical protein [Pseudomonas aeruginosa]AOY95904.1 hypothetical protein BKK79_29965 [Cupriavidus sp. USMAA2-4]MCP8466015.1 hypothetical protein [Pseudomonas triclosanedens]MDN7795988.1 hypothetical protein [Burkholderia vietnamiensis]
MTAKRKAGKTPPRIDAAMQVAIEQHTKLVFRVVLMWLGWVGVNLVAWAFWLHGQDYQRLRIIGAGTLAFWLAFTGFVWTQIIHALIEYRKLQRIKRLLKEMIEQEDGSVDKSDWK